MLEPHLHLLGVESDVDPATLLGLTTADARDPLLIERALRLRLAQVYQHPDHRTIPNSDMQLVLRSLRDAAAKLRSEAARLGPIRQPRPWILTEFDRNVLAVLVGYGGWNAHSRSRLVALAASEGVTPNGLLMVIRGLGEYAKSGGPALPISEIRPSPALTSANQSGGRSWAISEAFVEKFMPELKEESTRTTVKLSVLFGLLTLFVGVLALRFLLPVRHVEPAATVQTPAVVERAVEPAPRLDQAPAPAPETRHYRELFVHRPTFLGQAHPPEAVRLGDNIAEEIAALGEVARRLAVAGDEPAQIVYRYWSVAIEQISTAWLLLDRPTQERIDAAVLDVLFAAADTPTVTDSLLGSLMPRAGKLLEPLDIWRGAYMTTALAKIAAHEHLPPAVRERARRQLNVVLGETFTDLPGSGREPLAPQDRNASLRATAQAYLASIMPQLVEQVDYEPAAYDYWELWLAAQRRLSGGEQYANAIMNAAETILRSHPNLSGSNRAANVLGRLMEQVDFQHSPAVRHAAIGWFETEAINSDALWTLTSIMAFDDIAPWFGGALIVPPEANMSVRRRIRHDMERRWTLPDDAGAIAAGVIEVDEAAAANWNAMLSLVQADEAPATGGGRGGQGRLMVQLVASARLNEAAAMIVSAEHRLAERRLREVENLLSDTTRGSGRHGGTAAQTGGGDWGARYDEMRRNTEEKLRLLVELHNSRMTDLDPLDAAVLVREAYRGTPADVRTTAQEVLIQRFRDGRHVALELLDQFPDAGRSQAVSDLISEYTARILPLVSGGRALANDWSMEARLALVNHALSLWSTDTLGGLAGELSESYATQARVLLGATVEEDHPIRPAAAGEQLLEAWNQFARNQAGLGMASYERQALTNRHAIRLQLAEGNVQQFVAHQIGVLEIVALLTVHEQPHLTSRVHGLLQESSRRRGAAGHVLEQAVEVERTISVLWQMRMGGEVETSKRRNVETSKSAAAEKVEVVLAPTPDSPFGRLNVSSLHAAVLYLPTFTARTGSVNDWTQRLEALEPDDPTGYFLLAEEIADAARNASDTELARRLFALAAALAPDRLGRSACIALADLAEDEQQRRRFSALASLLAQPGRLGGWGEQPTMQRPAWIDVDDAAVLALCDALSFHRRGHGTRAASRLARGDAVGLLQSIEHALPSGTARAMIDTSSATRARPGLSAAQVVDMLQLEAALLAGSRRTWSSDLVLTQRNPLIEVDPNRLEEALDVDATQARFRNGRWVR